MFTAEDTYGTRKRFEFCRVLVREMRPALVLDVGCGTGTQLTRPLAEAFPEVRFIGVDPDEASIRHAQSLPALPNLQFGGAALLDSHLKADLVIASEVVEHVENPEQFLADLRRRLPENGRLVITVPNGYGPYEMVAALECLLRILRVYWVMRKIKRWLLNQPAPERAVMQDSLAISPHLSFFSVSCLQRLFHNTGLRIVRYQPRTFLCGFGFDKLLPRFGLCDWNAVVADRLPQCCNSAWMFILASTEAHPGKPFERGLLSRLRRRLNEACARLA
ncbi:MAG: class I SAM-dependent methyltransferase [Xanthomonadales bacterium]|nr:class I SAM-dependent methyltransferase [Xanthomonadales bacterium]